MGGSRYEMAATWHNYKKKIEIKKIRKYFKLQEKNFMNFITYINFECFKVEVL